MWFFKTGTLHFKLNLKKWPRSSSAHALQSFNFFYHKDHIIEYFFFLGNLQIPSFYFKEQSLRKKLKIKFVEYSLLGPQNGQNCFWLGQNKCFLSFFSFFALKNQEDRKSQQKTHGFKDAHIQDLQRLRKSL